MVGIVGAGGIGGTLFAAFQRFDYDFVCAILIAIIALIMIGEVLATAVRAIFIDNATSSTPPARAARCAARVGRGRLMASGFTPAAELAPLHAAQRLTRFLVYLCVVAAIVVSVQTIEVIPEFLVRRAGADRRSARAACGRSTGRIYPEGVHDALMETIHIASLGTLLGAVLWRSRSAFLAAHNLVPSRRLNYLAKLILVSSRSVNSLVWALLFVGIFGPGALAGTLAIAFRSIGFVGKLFGEALEEANRGRSRR